MAEEVALELDVAYQNDTLHFSLQHDATIHDLALHFADTIEAEIERVSLFILPKPGLKKHPFPDIRLSEIVTPKLRIKGIGTPTKDVQKLNEMAVRVAARRTARQSARQAGRQIKHNVNRDWKKVQEEATYTFHAIEPLTYLPNPAKSRRYLERLANDPGIKASMRKHKFSVGLLTEMNPAEHTTHESKTLGLNRNAGEVIELRLRTDSYDGYRDYKVIRKTLCHELAHNVHSEHDRNFWDLTKQIEKEVEQNDYLHGGHKVSEDEFYNPDDEFDDENADGGAWEGGEFVLGGTLDGQQGLSRREIMARAAMSRIEKQKALEQQQKQADAASQNPP
ncbi:hypothetical protein H2198_007582 [Neophaeococcomyces mojaviensis]|uniref:Uncharacterized protein n=1 Tax=Neophaeococcomyces mojaviensis TaxID=3383035 RepID=A0ACC2ZZK2_9EURO|nr:hypothetical protein H2198_007582 [Knufia sp. JES_112]